MHQSTVAGRVKPLLPSARVCCCEPVPTVPVRCAGVQNAARGHSPDASFTVRMKRRSCLPALTRAGPSRRTGGKVFREARRVQAPQPFAALPFPFPSEQRGKARSQSHGGKATELLCDSGPVWLSATMWQRLTCGGKNRRHKFGKKSARIYSILVKCT
jgi:hypothetical protein